MKGSGVIPSSSQQPNTFNEAQFQSLSLWALSQKKIRWKQSVPEKQPPTSVETTPTIAGSSGLVGGEQTQIAGSGSPAARPRLNDKPGMRGFTRNLPSPSFIIDQTCNLGFQKPLNHRFLLPFGWPSILFFSQSLSRKGC